MVSFKNLVPVTFLLAVGVAGCGGDRSKEQPANIIASLALSDHAVFIDQANDRAFLLDVGASPNPSSKVLGLPKRPLLAQRRLSPTVLDPNATDPDEVLVLSAGDVDSSEIGPSIAVLKKDQVARTYPLPAPFDSIVQSPDGRYVVAKFGQDNSPNRLLFNRNETAIIDLTQPPEEGKNPVDRTIRGFGDPPKRILFSPPMTINGEARQLALVLFKQVVAILDLNHLDRPEFTIELGANAPDAPAIDLEQVLFDTNENKIYLRGTASTDIYVVQLAARDAVVDASKNDFVPSLNQLGGGAQLKDMALYGAEADRRLLVAAGGNALVIDADSNRVTTVPLPAAATNMLVFRGRSPQVDTVDTRALLYSEGSSDVVFLDLGQIEDRKARNAERLKVSPYEKVIPLGKALGGTDTDNLVMLLHSGTLGASILNLDLRTVSRISTQVDLEGGLPDPFLNRVWVAPRSQDKLGFVELDPNKIQPTEVRLDYPVSDLLLFTQGTQKRVLVTHPSSIGRATLLEANALRDVKQAIVLEGYLLGE
ncbi:MAG: hypothetical protein SFV15_02295 [Polyangiaceae bacterium]|nr:hypothetical protein [Polyangiaceae bacterium]